AQREDAEDQPLRPLLHLELTASRAEDDYENDPRNRSRPQRDLSYEVPSHSFFPNFPDIPVGSRRSTMIAAKSNAAIPAIGPAHGATSRSIPPRALAESVVPVITPAPPTTTVMNARAIYTVPMVAAIATLGARRAPPAPARALPNPKVNMFTFEM